MYCVRRRTAIAEPRRSLQTLTIMPKDQIRVPPGPRGWPIAGVSFEVMRDPLRLMQRLARDYGDIVRFPVVMASRILLNHPDWIEQVLVLQHAKFHKSDFTKRAVERMLGQGLLISEGDFWRRQRRLAQPAFHKTRINEYASAMVQIARSHAQAWRDGETRDVALEMMALTLDVAVRTLFGTTLPGEAEQIGRALTYLMRYSLRRLRLPFRIPPHWPTPRNRRAQREHDFLDSIVYRIISERQSQPDPHHHNDLLSMLMGAVDEDGSRMSPKQLRDETMTLFIAGHETTALTLAWTWYALSQNPAAESALHEELGAVLAGRSPELADLPRLPYLQAVVNEILRLYPPAYIVARTSIEPCRIGGYDFPPGTTFLMSQWVMHRDPRYFGDPDSFHPERWLDGLMDRLPAGAYFPFGDGPRRCIGQGFALLEASLVIAELAQRFSFRLVPGEVVVPEPLVTLRPHNGIRMTLHARH
jgi:cytochrome P450